MLFSIHNNFRNLEESLTNTGNEIDMPSFIKHLSGALGRRAPNQQQSKTNNKDQKIRDIYRLLDQGLIGMLETEICKMPCHNKNCGNKFTIIQCFMPGEERAYIILKVGQKIHGGKTIRSTIIKTHTKTIKSSEESSATTWSRPAPVSGDRTFV